MVIGVESGTGVGEGGGAGSVSVGGVPPGVDGLPLTGELFAGGAVEDDGASDPPPPPQPATTAENNRLTTLHCEILDIGLCVFKLVFIRFFAHDSVKENHVFKISKNRKIAFDNQQWKTTRPLYKCFNLYQSVEAHSGGA
ncbi:MAG: hypothetical protein A3I66_12820 [Burkholderiales bacterium RIFCSPLOWO2_02_FULL_57_36]|nr:MAG: hypothetical protein A3I66_12820 [Burkholderiales bacterium RIFCSPLOWO2_02_FULL_57_36]